MAITPERRFLKADRFWDSLCGWWETWWMLHVRLPWLDLKEFFRESPVKPWKRKPVSLSLERLEKRWLPASGINEFAVGSFPVGLAVGGDGRVWFAESGKIGAITSAGVVTSYSLPNSSTNPYGVALGPDGNIWFTESTPPSLSPNNSTAIGKITTSGTVTEYALSSSSAAPHGMAAGPDGLMWFVESGTNKVGKITTSGTITEYTVPTAGSAPEDIVAGADGNLWFTEKSGNKIGVVTTSGTFTEYSVPTASSQPYGITLGPDGNIWFSEYAGNKIGRITPSGLITEFTIPTASSGPERLSAGPDGNVWFVENTKSKLANVTPDGSFWEIATPTASASPAGVTAAGSGAIWISEDGSSGRIGQNPWVGTSYPPYDNFSALGGPSGQGLPWEQDPLPGHRVPDPRFSLPNWEYLGGGWGPAGGGSAGGVPGAGGAQPVGSGPFVGTDPRWPPNGGVNPQPPYQPGALSSWGLDVVSPNSGDYMAQHLLDFRQSVTGPALDDSTAGNGLTALVYHSSVADAQPIIETLFTSDPNGAVPTSLKAQLTWNGTAQGWVTFTVSGHSAGDVYALDLQPAGAVTSTGADTWSVEVQANFTGGAVIDRIMNGKMVVVATGSPGFGTGWGLAGLDRLVADGTSGMIWVYGAGGARYFRSGPSSTYISPPNDFGTLVKNVSGTYTYTAKDRTQWNFDSAGKLTTITDPHNLSVTYTYSSTLLGSITEPDGGVTNFSYNAGGYLTTITEPGGRTVLLSRDGSNLLTGITNPDNSTRVFGYDGSVRLTSDQWSPTTTTITYDTTHDLATTINYGGGATLSIASVNGQGFNTSTTNPGSQAVGVVTDALGRVTSYGYDALGGITQVQTPDGGTQVIWRDQADQATRYQDALGRVTSYSYFYGNFLGDLLQINNPDGSYWAFTYDSTYHHLSAVQDPLGHLTTYTIDPATGDVTQVKNALNQLTTLTWSNGLLQTIKDPLGHLGTFQYDAGGTRRLVDMIDPTGARTTYAYDGAGNATSVQDARANTTNLGYDLMRRVTTLTYADTGQVTMTYNGRGELTGLTDQLGHATQYQYDQHGWLTTITEALGSGVQRTTTLAYNAVGTVLSETDPRGTLTSFGYDKVNRLTTMIEAYGVTGLQRTTAYAYDLAGNLTKLTDPKGNVTSLAYDSMNRPTTVTEAVGASIQRTTAYAYDLNGDLVKVTDPLGTITSVAYDKLNRPVTVTSAVGTSIQATATMAYDAAGNILSATDALGHTTSFGYDADNRTTQVIEAFGTARQRTTSIGYDAVGNVVTVTDARGYVTSNAYDAVNQLTTVTEGVGQSVQRTTAYAYDLAGNLVKVTDPGATVTSVAYDALNRATTTTEAVGTSLQRTTSQGFDANDNVTTSTDAQGYVTSMQYDVLNRLTTVTDAANETTAYIYDANNNRIGVTDPLNHVTSYGFDQLNRAVTITDARGGVTTLGYDANDNATSVIDSVGNRTTMSYDALDRPTQETDPFNRSSSMAYDAANRVTSATDRLGRRESFSYDELNRLTTEAWFNASGTAVNTLTYAFDGTDNLTQAADAHGTYTMSYDPLGRVTAQQEPFSQALTMAYDAMDNRTQLQDSQNGVTTYSYDALHRLATVQFGGSGQTPLRADLTYTPRDDLGTVTRYSDLAGTQTVGYTSYTYDQVERLTNIQHLTKSGGTVLENFTYTYDAASRLSSEQDNGNTPVSYSYDNTDQLTSDGTNNYGYDLNGNRNTGGYQTTLANQMTNDGTWTYTYDAEGNLTKKSKGPSADTWLYSYDNLNRLVTAVEQATDGGTTLTAVTYTYDVFENRLENDVWKSGFSATATRYAYDGSVAWADLDASNGNALVTRYVHAGESGMLLARVSAGGTTAWYLPDRLGSVRNLTDSSGNLIDTLTYDGFGNVTESNSAVGDRFKYAGLEFDGATGLMHAWARYYDPASGRWTGQDPSRFTSGDPNFYRYVGNEPTGWIDPAGLWPWGAEARRASDLDARIAEMQKRRDDAYPGWREGHHKPAGDLVDKIGSVHTSLTGPSGNTTASGGYPAIDPAFKRNFEQGTKQAAVIADVGIGVQGATAGLAAASSAAAIGIRITPRGLGHVLARHFPGGALTAGKSLFDAGEDVPALIRLAESIAASRQAGGNFERIVDAGRIIGTDRVTGQPTSIFTVITNAAGDLITAFPGRP